MALYGVLGDIHGNREALAATLALLDGMGVQRLLCVGDIVGYNADPDECVDAMRKRGALSIAGNHDLIGVGRLGFARCSNKAMYSLKQTRRRLGAAAAAYLAALPQRLALGEGVVLVHGGVRDVEQYLRTAGQVRQNAAHLRSDFPGARVCFYGHTHEQKVFEVHGEAVRELAPEGTLRLRADRLYFINPGSVDASRKREHKFAECAVLSSDSTAQAITFHRIGYDEAATERKAAGAGYRIGAWTERLYTLRRRLLRA
jgi:predicted phosphodiesterase